MMLQLKNNLLQSDSLTIESSDYSFELQSDIDCLFFGVITLNNGAIKTIQFSKISNIYKARLIITKDILPFLKDSTFKLSCISSSFNKYTNEIPLDFNESKINLDIKVRASKDLEELEKKVYILEQRLSSLTKTGVVPNINIQNKEMIKPGMTLVSLDEQGNFAAAYPFVDIISEVNGQRAIDGVVIIDASMIKYNTDRTIADQFNKVAEAIKKTNEAIQLLSSDLKVINTKIRDLRFDLDTHLDNGI